MWIESLLVYLETTFDNFFLKIPQVVRCVFVKSVQWIEA